MMHIPFADRVVIHFKNQTSKTYPHAEFTETPLCYEVFFANGFDSIPKQLVEAYAVETAHEQHFKMRSDGRH